MFLPYEKFQLCYLSSRQESSFTEEFIYFVFVPVLCHCSTDCLCLFFNKSHYKNLPLHLDPLFHLTQCLSEVKMGRGSPIPPMLWRKIVEQYQKGVSQREIAKSLKLSSSTVHNIIQRFRESGTISVRKGQGRKTILDARDLRALRRHCITYRNATVMEITTWAQEYFQKTLSVNTIHRAIRRCRLKLYRSKKKPYLNMIQKRRRFLWAKAHLKWTVAKWKTVLWSDESKF